MQLSWLFFPFERHCHKLSCILLRGKNYGGNLALQDCSENGLFRAALRTRRSFAPDVVRDPLRRLFGAAPDGTSSRAGRTRLCSMFYFALSLVCGGVSGPHRSERSGRSSSLLLVVH